MNVSLFCFIEIYIAIFKDFNTVAFTTVCRIKLTYSIILVKHVG